MTRVARGGDTGEECRVQWEGKGNRQNRKNKDYDPDHHFSTRWIEPSMHENVFEKAICFLRLAR